MSGETVADSISVCRPRDGEAAVKAVRTSNGWGVRVSDDDILQAIPELARGAAVFAEPAAAAAYAGLEKAVESGKVDPDWTTVLLVTGNGLKDIASVMKVAGEPRVIPPDAGVLRKIYPDG